MDLYSPATNWASTISAKPAPQRSLFKHMSAPRNFHNIRTNLYWF